MKKKKDEKEYEQMSSLKARETAYNKMLAKQSPGIAINPYNYESRFGLSKPRVLRVQEEVEYQKSEFTDVEGKKVLVDTLDEQGNKIPVGKKKIYHY
jgi:hypothetical protein